MNQKLLFESILLVGMVSTQQTLAQKKRTQGQTRPNAVFILTDDLGYGDLSCYGQEKFETPNIDRLAQNDMRFIQCYSGTTVNAPSHSCLITGTYSGHTAIRGNKKLAPEGQFPLPENSQTIFDDFRNTGYRTGTFDKRGLGYIGSAGDPNKQGIDQFYGYSYQLLAHSYYPDHLWDNDKRVDLSDNNLNVQYGKRTYSQDLIHSKALVFLDEAAKDKDKPFFMWYPTIIPHAELIVPEDSIVKKFKGKYPEKPHRGAEPGSPGFRKGGYCTQFYPRATFAAMAYRLGVYIGQIVQKLKDMGVHDNTIIIFSSDNGPHMEGDADPDFFSSNSIWRGYKRGVYEGGIRVPMVILWPERVQPNTETDFICSFWDSMPTFREVLDSKVDTRNMDGVSILPSLQNRKGQKEHEYLYFESPETNGRQAVRKGDWKLVHMNIRGSKPYYELCNLASNSSEKHNVPNLFPRKADELRTIMKEVHAEDSSWPLFR